MNSRRLAVASLLGTLTVLGNPLLAGSQTGSDSAVASQFAGLWTGTFSNSLGGGGPSTLTLRVVGGQISGDWDGVAITQATRVGTTVRWSVTVADNGRFGRTTYHVQVTLVGEGRLRCTYEAVAESQTYSGSGDYTRQSAAPGPAEPGGSSIPVFGPLDAGGMPRCLHEVNAGRYVEAELVLSGVPYVVWVALRQSGSPPNRAAWRPFGPVTLEGGRRYLFRSGTVTQNQRPTSTTVSPGLASLHFENVDQQPVWIVVNPLPPGCDDSGGAGSDSAIASQFAGLWTGTFSNSLGGGGPSTLTLRVVGGQISGDWDGLAITNATRVGTTVRWSVTVADNGRLGRTTYHVQVTLVGEGRLRCTYEAVAESQTYSGSGDYARR